MFTSIRNDSDWACSLMTLDFSLAEESTDNYYLCNMYDSLAEADESGKHTCLIRIDD